MALQIASGQYSPRLLRNFMRDRGTQVVLSVLVGAFAYSTAGRSAPSTRMNTPSTLRVVSLETGAKRLLTEADALQPSWSPNGHRIAYWFMPPNVGRSAGRPLPLLLWAVMRVRRPTGRRR